jgi:hypothetical protein
MLAGQPPLGFKSTKGFGFQAAFDADKRPRAVASVTLGLESLLGENVPWMSVPHMDALAFLVTAFSTMFTAATPDWFSISRCFGHPAHALSKTIYMDLHLLRHGLAIDDAALVKETAERLADDAVVEMLESARDALQGAATPEEKDWAYIAWSPVEPGMIAAGARLGVLEDIMWELPKAQKGSRAYGPLAAWLVHDVDAAALAVAKAMSGQPCKNDLYVANLNKARGRIEAALIADRNLVLSPWHVEDDSGLDRLVAASG